MSRIWTIILLILLPIPPANADDKWHFPTAISSKAYVTKHHINFAAQVESVTQGRLQIDVHPGGSLFKTADILRAVRTGQVQIGATGLFLHASEDPMFALTNLPFLVKNIDEARTLVDLANPAVEEALKEKNLKLLYRAIWIPHGLFSAKPLQNAEDLEGMRIRSYDTATTRIAQLAKAIPTKTETSEVSLAYSTAVIEGSFGSGIAGVSQKLWDYIDYYYTINYALPTSSVFVNLDSWNRLPPDIQTTILKIAADTERAAWLEMVEIEQQSYKKMREAGMKVLKASPELAAHFDKIGQQIVAEWLERAGEEGELILSDLTQAISTSKEENP